MDFKSKITLGKTGLMAGRLGISSSFRAPGEAYEEAFEKGCNYFTWGTFIKGRDKGMQNAIQNICRKQKRDDLIISMLTYAHSSLITDAFYKKGLKALGVDYADVLVLGYFPKRPPQRVIDGALRLKEKGLVRFLGLTSHNRKVFPELAKEGIIDIFHIRYNAAHRGAEDDVFPLLPKEKRPGIVTFTATCWRKLLKSGKLPADLEPLTPHECYRFVMTNDNVDICMMGSASLKEMRENLAVLETGPLNNQEMFRAREVGDYIYGRKKK